jgi:hypothetical protein
MHQDVTISRAAIVAGRAQSWLITTSSSAANWPNGGCNAKVANTKRRRSGRGIEEMDRYERASAGRSVSRLVAPCEEPLIEGGQECVFDARWRSGF